MTRALPDVNVLLALLWPHHTAHNAAMAWFGKTGRKAWATNSLIQLGVLRLLTNPKITRGGMSPREALEVVAEATRHEGLEFWLDREPAAQLQPFAASLTGYRQWNDALLLEQAAAHEGVLVTFDSGLKEMASAAKCDRVLLLNAG